MITINPDKPWCGKTTDPKPTENVPNGQVLIMIDTDEYYFKFDAETKTWIKK